MPHAARRDPRDPRRVPRGRRRHHRDQHLQRDARSRRPTTAWRRSCYELNVAAARLAREAADRLDRAHAATAALRRRRDRPDEPHALALARRQRPARSARSTSTQVRDAYAEQVRGLIDGGVDLLLVETIFDTLNAKAALVAIDEVFDASTDVRLPVMISVTITDRSGRTLSGQTVEAFWTSVAHAKPLSVGINCALGAREMRPYLAELAALAPIAASAATRTPACPNAFGGYDETPETTAALLREFAESGLVNIVGGCCGTTPDHIRAIAEARRAACRRAPVAGARRRVTRAAPGLEPLASGPTSNFLMIGERTNVTGSKRFAKLDQGRRLHDGARGRARAGARRRQHPRRQHGRGHARLRARDDDAS